MKLIYQEAKGEFRKKHISVMVYRDDGYFMPALILTQTYSRCLEELAKEWEMVLEPDMAIRRAIQIIDEFEEK